MFIYSCSVKIPASGFNKCWKVFSASCWLWECFLCISCQDAWRSGSLLARGQKKMADEAKLCTPMHSTFEVLVVWLALSQRRFGPFLLTNDGCRTCSFQWFSDVMVHQDSESCSGSDGQQTTKHWPWNFGGASLALGSALELFLGPSTEVVITGCCMKSTFHCMSQSNLDMVHCCCIE